MDKVFEAYDHLAQALKMQNLNGNLSLTLHPNDFNLHLYALETRMPGALKKAHNKYGVTSLDDIKWFKISMDTGTTFMFFRGTIAVKTSG